MIMMMVKHNPFNFTYIFPVVQFTYPRLSCCRRSLLLQGAVWRNEVFSTKSPDMHVFLGLQEMLFFIIDKHKRIICTKRKY